MRSQTLAEVLTEQLPTPVAIVSSGVLNAGTKAIMYGKPKTLKSIAAKRLMLALGQGEPWLGFETPKTGVKVLYVQLEVTKYELQYRLRVMSGGKGQTKASIRVWTTPFLKLDTVQGQTELVAEIKETGCQLVILDPIYKLVTGDMLQAVSMTPVLDWLDRVIYDTGVAVMLIHHQRKSPGSGQTKSEKDHDGGSADDMMGSVLFSAWPDTVIKVKRERDVLTYKFELARNARGDIEDVQVKIEPTLSLSPTRIIKI